MKKVCAALLLLVCMSMLFGCKKADVPRKDDGVIDVVCVTFPQYDWTRELIKGLDGRYNVTLLLQQGTDMHSFQPTAQDIVTVSECDLLIYGGGESEKWIAEALAGAKTKPETICLMEILGDGVKEEAYSEGMQETEQAKEPAEGIADGDEHVWLSVPNAMLFSDAIAKKLMELDGENKQVYQTNLDNYLEDLKLVHEELCAVVSEADFHTVVVADRFPFLYMMEDYGIEYYAAFSGCSAETEASFETITFLAGKLDELTLPAVIVLENSDGRLAGAIIDNTAGKNQKIVELWSMQSVTKQQLSDMTYIGCMRQNVSALREALYK